MSIIIYEKLEFFLLNKTRGCQIRIRIVNLVTLLFAIYNLQIQLFTGYLLFKTFVKWRICWDCEFYVNLPPTISFTHTSSIKPFRYRFYSFYIHIILLFKQFNIINQIVFTYNYQPNYYENLHLLDAVISNIYKTVFI